MAKWYGIVGYIVNTEQEPGIWVPKAVEKKYYGDNLKSISKWTSANKANDDLSASNQISIVADPFAYRNFQSIRYIEFMGAMWDVTAVELRYPRLIMNVGGVYNGEREQAEIAE